MPARNSARSSCARNWAATFREQCVRARTGHQRQVQDSLAFSAVLDADAQAHASGFG
jgi:hypothetical protein